MAAAAAAASQKTASIRRSEFVQGTHQLDIVGYSKLKTLGIRHSIRSGDFEVGGFIWALICTFDKRRWRGIPHISFELSSISLELSANETDHPVTAMAAFRINDPTGGPLPAAVWRSEKAKVFAPWYSTTGPATWELSVPDAFLNLETRYVDKDDRLTIHCTVDVLQEESADGPACFVPVPPPTISQDIHMLLANKWWSDVTFVVEETKIKAHKLVLAMRSPVFRAKFLGNMMEGGGGACVIPINDMTAATFKAMLHFIYTDTRPKPKAGACPVAMARDLLVAADLYDLERLRLMCESVLSESVDVSNVMPTLALVRGRVSCRQLEESCIEYMASDSAVYDAVKATEEYVQLKQIDRPFIDEVTEKVADRAVAACTSSSSSSSNHHRLLPRKSASTYDPSAVVVGSHEFRMDNFSALHKRHVVAQHILSGSFTVGGYDWKILVYPAGATEEGHVSLYLVIANLTDPAAQVVASVTLKIDDPSGTSPAISRRFKHTFTVRDRSSGFPDFVAVAAAKSGYVGHDGSLTVHCRVEVTEPRTSTTTLLGAGPAIAVPPSNMAWHLEQLLASEKGSDVIFLAEDESEIRAHALVIAARSPVLHEAATGNTVKMDGVRAVVLRAVLHFVYTDELPRKGDVLDATTVAGEMLAAAGRFGLERMKLLCVNWLADNLTAGNALATLDVARQHNRRDLEKYCVDYIALPHVVREVYNLKVTCT